MCSCFRSSNKSAWWSHEFSLPSSFLGSMKGADTQRWYCFQTGLSRSGVRAGLTRAGRSKIFARRSRPVVAFRHCRFDPQLGGTLTHPLHQVGGTPGEELRLVQRHDGNRIPGAGCIQPRRCRPHGACCRVHSVAGRGKKRRRLRWTWNLHCRARDFWRPLSISASLDRRINRVGILMAVEPAQTLNTRRRQ